MKKIKTTKHVSLHKRPKPNARKDLGSKRIRFRVSLAKSTEKQNQENRVFSMIESEREFPKIDATPLQREEDQLSENQDSVESAILLQPEIGPLFLQNHEIGAEMEVDITIDRQALVDDIVQSILISETKTQETKALLELKVAQKSVIVEITKYKNKSKIRFQTEDKTIRQLLKTTRSTLRRHAKSAGIRIAHIQIQ